MGKNNGLRRQAGFTFPELLVVGTLLLVFVGVMLVLVRPNNVDAERNNAKRRLDLAAIMVAIADYQKQQGHLPPTIAGEDTAIATSEEGLSLCDDLVPHYMDDLPIDPTAGFKVNEEDSCVILDQYYMSGYIVRVEQGGRVVLSAPAAENKETITVERWFPYL